MMLAAAIALCAVIGVPSAWALQYLRHVRRSRQWWLDHPEEAARRRARAQR